MAERRTVCLLFSLFIFIYITAVCSCSLSGGRRPLTSELDEIDSLIEQGLYTDASSQLKKTEKHASGSWEHIGVYRRYMQLGEKENAERVLKHAVARNPHNPELCSVYSHFLLREGRTAEALRMAESLQNTRYGSFYSEAVLRSKEEKSEDTGDINPYLKPTYMSVYYDAYTGSKDTYWLRDWAVIGMMQGNTSRVVALQPDRFVSLSDAYFWALVQYDCGNFDTTATDLADAAVLYTTAPVQEQRKVTTADLTVLSSDVYNALSDADRAEQIRRTLLGQLAEADPDDQITVPSDLLPYIYVNCAVWAEGRGDDTECRRLLALTVQKWPDFVPGLILYADFAYRSSLPRKEDAEQLALRASGVATLEMQKYDSRPRIPVADAAARMDAGLVHTHDPLLYIARLDLKYKTDASLTTDDKIADLWRVLEKNTTDVDQYPPLLFEYAVNLLIKYDHQDDAWQLFRQYVGNRCSFDPARNFWDQVMSQIHSLSLSEAEYAAWFAASQRLGATAQRLYEYCVYESDGSSGESGSRQITPGVTNQSCMNLAMVYNCRGDRRDALDLYGQTAGRTSDIKQKAEILYRMGCVYEQEGNRKDAVRSAEYALSLDPSHARAQLLRDRLTEKE
jgi:Tfp pilus assembly protein PilF